MGSRVKQDAKVAAVMRQRKGLLAIDPGTRTGWAWFENELLVDCGTTTRDGMLELLLAPSWLKWGGVIVERPRSYPGIKSAAPPNDLMELDHWAGRFVQQAVHGGAPVHTMHPHEWKRTMPKDIVAQRVWENLSREERAIQATGLWSKRSKKLAHDGVEAIGMGLWYLRRNWAVLREEE